MMAVNSWKPVSGVLATSELIDAYGGFSISEELLWDLARQFNDNAIPFNIDHQLSKPVRVREFEAFVQSRNDGIFELQFRAQIHVDDMYLLESRPALSITLTSPISRDRAQKQDNEATIAIAADYAWFAAAFLLKRKQRCLSVGWRFTAFELSTHFSSAWCQIPKFSSMWALIF